MTGQPPEPTEKDREKAWNDRTRALAACLEALLELHRTQDRTAPPNDADRASDPGEPPRRP